MFLLNILRESKMNFSMYIHHTLLKAWLKLPLCNKIDRSMERFYKQFLGPELDYWTNKKYMWLHSHKKRKDSLETQVVLLIFLFELEISGVSVQRIHQNSQK